MFVSDSDRMSSSTASHDGPVTIAFLVLQAVVSFILVAASVLNSFVVDSCGSGLCNDGLITFSGYLILIGAVLFVILAVGFAGLQKGRGRRTWWIPLVGIAAVVVLFLISWELLALGTGKSVVDFIGPAH
jgi:hypothetical protein